MFNLLLLLSAAFLGDTQVKEWGDIGARFAVGVPLCNRLNLVDFTLGISQIGIGSSIVESYGFNDGTQFIGSLLPLHVTVPIYQHISFWKEEAFFDKFLILKLRGSPWGQRYNGTSPLSFILSPEWAAEAPYLSLELTGRWSPIRMLGLEATLGTLVPKDAPLRVYLTLGAYVGTSGPVSPDKVAPRLEISNIIFDDALTGDGDGVLDPREQGRLILLLANRGLRDSDTIYLYPAMRDTSLSKFLVLEGTTAAPLKAGRSTEATINVFAGEMLPALPLRVRVWGKDSDSNLVSPAYIEIPTVGS